MRICAEKKGCKKMDKNKKNPSKNMVKKSTDDKDTKKKKDVENGKEKDDKLELEPSEKLIHQILPFVFVVLAVLLEACFILASIDSAKHLVGSVGEGLKNVFCGLFSWSAFLVPVALINLACNWRKFIENKIGIAKSVFTFLFLISLSALIHVCVKVAGGNNELVLQIDTIWAEGKRLVGGGILGGYFAELVYAGLKIVGSIIIFSALTFISLIFSLGMTPRNIAIIVRYKLKLMSERRKEAQKAQREEIERKKKEEAEAREREEQEDREIAERIRREEKERALRKRSEEERRIEEAERRAIEIEEEEKRQKDLAGAIPIIRPSDEMVAMEAQEAAIAAKDDGKTVDVKEIFKNPPEEYKAGRIELPPVDESAQDTSETLEIEMKPITDMEGVPDDGEEGAIVPEELYQEYVFPPVEMLKNIKTDQDERAAHEELMANAQALMETLKSFNVRIQEITYSRGPTITRYELKPDTGVRIRSIANLVDDIALSLATTGVRIEAPIPNKAAVGVEVPNKHAAVVSLRSLIDTQEFAEKKSKLSACLGKDVGGNPIYFDIGKMPHMLIAGTTGSGKSVCINSIIISLLYKASPRDVKLILIDPKKVEFNIYKSIPHLYAPIVSDPKKAAGALASAVAEMERRFELIEAVGARDIAGYNAATADDPTKEFLPYIVIIIDELADLMMTAPDDVENAICRIAQKARAAGIHLVIGTQRPSVDVITGLLKSNIPSRIAFAVASQVDSRTILDGAGAEKLIGRGDMLFSPIGVTKPMRIQGSFVSEGEIEEIVEFLRDNNDGVQFNDEFMRRIEEEAAKCGNKKGGGGGSVSDDEPCEEGGDPKFKAAVDVAIEMGKISTSLLQRRLEIGYGRAAKIIDRMEELGYVSAPDGNKPRKVLVTKMEFMEKRINDEIE